MGHATIGSICQREVRTAALTEKVQIAAGRMAALGIDSLVMLDHEGRPVGIVTDRDLTAQVVARGAGADRLCIGDLISHAPAIVGEHTALEEATELLRKSHLEHLAVVDASGRLVGIVSRGDVLRSGDDAQVVAGELWAEELGAVF